jgi:hypothetical protein
MLRNLWWSDLTLWTVCWWFWMTFRAVVWNHFLWRRIESNATRLTHLSDWRNLSIKSNVGFSQWVSLNEAFFSGRHMGWPNHLREERYLSDQLQYSPNFMSNWNSSPLSLLSHSSPPKSKNSNVNRIGYTRIKYQSAPGFSEPSHISVNPCWQWRQHSCQRSPTQTWKQ